MRPRAGRAPAGRRAARGKRPSVSGGALDSGAAPPRPRLQGPSNSAGALESATGAAGAPPRARRRASSNAYDRIYAVVRRIPRGRVVTYGEVAAAAGFPHAPRLAGYALHALAQGSPLPWHRVVGAGGRLSLARLSPDGALTQRMRLEREGVRFDARGRVVLRTGARPGRGSARGSPRRG